MITPTGPIRYGENLSAHAKAAERVITISSELQKTKDYQKVKDVVVRLIESGLSKMGEGYCISVSDILFNLLTQNGVKCHLSEVQLSIVDQKTNATQFIGFHTTFQQNSHTRVSTHVVVVTDTEIPMLIDLSIAHKLPSGMQCVIEKVENKGSKVLAESERDGFTFLYQEKKDGIGVPQLHQISILDRISTDKKIFKEIKILRVLNYIGIILSSFAAINVIANIIIEGW
jgi:hypothetical protein